MNGNKRGVLLTALAVIVAAAIFMFYKPVGVGSPREVDRSIHFVKSSGYIAGYPGDKVMFPCVFLVDTRTSAQDLIADVQLLHSENVSLESWQVFPGSEYKGYKLDNITLTLRLDRIGESPIEGLKIKYKDDTEQVYPMDKMFVKVLQKASSNVVVGSQETAVSPLSRTSFDLKNNSNDKVTLEGISFISNEISPDKIVVTKGDTKYDHINGIILAPAETVSVSLEVARKEESDVFFARPLLQYNLAGQRYTECVTLGTLYGLPFSEEKMQKVYDRLTGQSKQR
ncbi:hypothetical protein GTO89_03330 [Heliobacterium gestii]|uniref:Uncharacterized protein n=1 Tax=Heliomicrobium gestii TaxID=2699 RepID=A0A845L5Z4_HELGE|nr:hypothetical protein [Heliomicrobium gestii]MBM7865826.1 hypothetical protein [Heliomicrobium gestii]MZP42067.1 hypothetical protein [Heliomicrobium gestii]